MTLIENPKAALKSFSFIALSICTGLSAAVGAIDAAYPDVVPTWLMCIAVGGVAGFGALGRFIDQGSSDVQ